jgi:flagellin-like protein
MGTDNKIILNSYLRKKGVSPVIATILLISLTIVIGIIIFLWFRGMNQEVITKSGGKNVELVCSDVQFDAEYSSSRGELSITNTGNIPIFGFDIKKHEGFSYSTENLRDLSSSWPREGLNQGESKKISITFDAGVEKITLIPELLGSSDKGTRTFVCNEKQHGYEILI